MSNTRRDLDKEIASAVSLVAAARTTTANGTAVDLAGYDAAVALVSAGVVTDGTHTITLEESDASGSGFATVAAGNLSGSFTALTSSVGGSDVQEVGYLGTKRYVRAVVTCSGTTTGGVYAVTIVRGRARTLPQ